MPSFYPENNTAKPSDDAMRSLHKLVDGGGGGGTLSGPGAPGAGLGADGQTYWDETNKDLYVKDLGTWLLIVDTV